MGLCNSTSADNLETVSPAFLAKWCETFVCSTSNCARSNGTDAFFSFRDNAPYYQSCGHLICMQCRDSRLKDPAHSHFTCDKCNASTTQEALEQAHVVKEVVRELSQIGLPCSGCGVNHSNPSSAESSTESKSTTEGADDSSQAGETKYAMHNYYHRDFLLVCECCSDFSPIKPDETAIEWTKRFFLLCQYCRASGATHYMSSECQLLPFERHHHVEEFDEYPLMSSELVGRNTWHLTMGSRKFVEKINRMRSCSRCGAGYGKHLHATFKIWREMTSHNQTELKFVHVKGKCLQCDAIHKPVRHISAVAVELADVHGFIVPM